MFVDDEPLVVKGLARNISMMDRKMDIIVHTSAQDALAALGKEVVDVIITDLYMPGFDGIALLKEVRNRYPSALRFVLSGEARPEVVVEANRLAHQYLSKPCETAQLHKTIVDMLLHLETIKDPGVVRTISLLEAVPSRQAMLADFFQLLNDHGAPLDRIAASLKREPGLCARLLKVANSPYFGHSGSIGTMDDAIGLLGMDMVLSMAASHKIFEVTPPPPESNLGMDDLWEHCVFVSTLVRRLSFQLKVPQQVLREASTAALLHDIGKLVLAYSSPTGYAAACTRARADGIPGWQAEHYVFGNHHAEVGGCLLKLWGLPPGVVDGVSFHHTPHHSLEGVVDAATLLHIADTVAHPEPGDVFLDAAHLESVGLPEDLEHWRRLLLSD